MSRPSLLCQQRALACSFSPLLKSCCCLWLISALGWLCALGSSSQLCLSQRSPYLLALLHFSQRFPHCLVHPHQRFPHWSIPVSAGGSSPSSHPWLPGRRLSPLGIWRVRPATGCLHWGLWRIRPTACGCHTATHSTSHHQLNQLNRLWLLICCQVQLHLRQSLSRCLAQLRLCQRSARLHVHSLHILHGLHGLHIHIHSPTQTNTSNLPGHLKLSAPVLSLVGVLEGTFCTTAAAHAAQPPDLLDLCAASHVITFWICFACAPAVSYAVVLWT